jgi:hypothetical protein
VVEGAAEGASEGAAVEGAAESASEGGAEDAKKRDMLASFLTGRARQLESEEWREHGDGCRPCAACRRH